MNAALQVQGLSMRFGGLKAVDDVSFDVAPGTVHALIGPNGAGKTTLINMVTGMYTPSGGRVLLHGEEVTGHTPQQLARLGMARTFQNLQVCMNMGALDNVMVGAHLRQNRSLLAGLFAWPALVRDDARCRQEALDAMARVGLSGAQAAEASQMPYGELKRLEIARALMARPRLLLMDEPAAGLNPTETVELGRLIRGIADGGVTVLLVEHDMPLVMGISDSVTVLDHGKLLASGSPAEVRNDPRVIEAYLGPEALQHDGAVA